MALRSLEIDAGIDTSISNFLETLQDTTWEHVNDLLALTGDKIVRRGWPVLDLSKTSVFDPSGRLELFEMFVLAMKDCFMRMWVAAVNKDYGELKDQAHAIRWNALVMGMTEFSKIAEDIENALVREEKDDYLIDLIKSLYKESQELGEVRELLESQIRA